MTDKYKYDFLLSHAGHDGRQIALELEGQLAFLGLDSYIARLENIKIRDDEFLLEKMIECRSMIVIFTEEYCKRLNKKILATDNFVCYEINNAFGFKVDEKARNAIKERYPKTLVPQNRLQGIYTASKHEIIILGFGNWTKHSLIRNFKESQLISFAASKILTD